MPSESLFHVIFVIFTGAALAATLALYARQALLVAYILLGVLLGPSMLGWVHDARVIQGISEVGIIFLLFLLGLDMPVRKLLSLVGETTLVTGASSLMFAAVGWGLAAAFGYGTTDSLLVGAALMFSSTILGLKLLPTTILHHKRTGEIIVSILLLQDLIAILILLLLQFMGGVEVGPVRLTLLLVSLPLLFLLAYVLDRFVLLPLIQRFDTIQEYIFLLAIGWCLGFAELAVALGLSQEIGAFVAGVVLATSPIAMFIAESLKPLRDFFLVMFFFSLGAGFDLSVLDDVWLPALLLAAGGMLLKPLVFRWLLVWSGELPERAGEIGWRLGQISEFSLLIAVLALELDIISREAGYLIQAATILSFIASSYLIVARYPTPIAVSDRLRRN